MAVDVVSGRIELGGRELLNGRHRGMRWVWARRVMPQRRREDFDAWASFNVRITVMSRHVQVHRRGV
ncbi:hypothetical protein [Streptomyces halobius]|uniref:Uncharacterized protein n=1 Tax=Streptomyces halobius TaxID=2879846 RepID=A0ABY4M3T0_9ACTN|nr:hypothetical protein [Streptomyces halobius]UQA91051.1 hypothetical protein K9S39_03400 [Streptomyces halobius]